MKENNILDDLDIHDGKAELTGTNTQLFRGLFFAIPIQFMLWVALLKGVNFLNENMDFESRGIYRIESIGYGFNILSVLVFGTFLIGSGSFIFFANIKNQAYKKIIPLGLFFSFCYVLALSTWRGIQENEAWYQLLIDFYGGTLMVISFQFTLIASLVLLVKKKWLPIAILMLIGVFLLVGFIP